VDGLQLLGSGNYAPFENLELHELCSNLATGRIAARQPECGKILTSVASRNTAWLAASSKILTSSR